MVDVSATKAGAAYEFLNPTPISVSSCIIRHILALTLLFFQEKPKIGLILSVFLWVLAAALEGVDSLTVKARSAAVLLS